MPDWSYPETSHFYKKVWGSRKLTQQQVAILEQLLVKPCWGYDIYKATSIRQQTIYENLARFKAFGVIQESFIPSSSGPARKEYRLTEQGREFAIKMVDDYLAEEALKNEDTPMGEQL